MVTASPAWSALASLAYPVGPLESGLAKVVGIVLTYSRLTIGLASAASMTRAARGAQKYTEFRTAFGSKIHQFPMVANQVAQLEKYAHRTVAGAFKLYQSDLQRARQWYRPAEFVKRILSGGDVNVIQAFAEEIEILVAHPSLLEPDAKTRNICERWDFFCHRFFHAYQEVAYAEVIQ